MKTITRKLTNFFIYIKECGIINLLKNVKSQKMSKKLSKFYNTLNLGVEGVVVGFGVLVRGGENKG